MEVDRLDGKGNWRKISDSGQDLLFDPLNFQVKRGDHVIVETARGVEYGTVVGFPQGG